MLLTDSVDKVPLNHAVLAFFPYRLSVMPLRTSVKSHYDFGHSGSISFLLSSIFSNMPIVAGISSFFGLSVPMNRLTIRVENSVVLLPNAGIIPVSVV